MGIDVEYKKGISMKFGILASLTKKLPLLGVEFQKESRNWIQRAIGLCDYVAMKYRFGIAYYTNILAQHQLYHTICEIY